VRKPAARTVLDQQFSSTSLHALRNAVRAAAVAAGLSASRACDVRQAVHELAANAITHGSGTGRAQVRITETSLHCQVADTGRPRAARPASWPVMRGGGLWLARRVSDRLTITSSPVGSVVTLDFTLI
jgi:anti-sigma regulatory factor (Ser/Thr protein kinase)